jgi:hypothetical protein
MGLKLDPLYYCREMPVTTRSSTRSPPTSRTQHTYSLRENRPVPGFFANMDNDWEDSRDVDMAAQALMMLANSTETAPVRRSARIASRA